MIDPQYQDIKDANLPKISKDGVHLKGIRFLKFRFFIWLNFLILQNLVISGRFYNFSSPLRTIVPTLILDFKLDKDASHSQSLP